MGFMRGRDGRVLYRESGSGRFVPVRVPLSKRQIDRRKVGRNDPCPCGSGVKFKKCCLKAPRGERIEL